MKKVLLTLIAVLMAVPAFAVEVYNNEGNTVNLYGTLRGYVGYGHGMDSLADSSNDDFLYGIQGNSRIGVRLKMGQFSAQVELGANEKTLYSGSTSGTVGLRQAWGAYTFGNAGTLLAGKTDTPTTMSGFSADIMDTDTGLKGFGGNGTGNRRFQIAYRIAGVDIALIENDMGYNAGNVYDTGKVDDSGKIIYTSRFNKDDLEYIPRIGISYTFKNESLMAKVGATYTAINGRLKGDLTDPDTRWATVHAFGIVAGVKPTFMDGRLWLAIQARYGMNEHLYGEASTAYNYGTFAHKNISNSAGIATNVEDDGTVNNTSRVNAMIELGYKVTDSFSAIIGGGYQWTKNEVDGAEDVNSGGVYVQFPYSFSKNFALIPELTYLNTTMDGETIDAIVLVMQARFSF